MKYAVVTGIDRGLGLALVEELLNKGWMVIGGCLMEAEGALLELINSNKESLHVSRVDVSDDESVANFAKTVNTMTRSVDMLINNAGILGKTDETILDTLDFDDMLSTFKVNALGTLRVTNALIDLLLHSNDKLIVNISSEAASIGNNWRESWYGYGMSKAAANMAGDITHQKIKSEGGRVFQVHPGYLKTYMHGHYNEDGSLDARESASAIIDVINSEATKAIEAHAIYIGYDGQRLPW